MRGRGRSFGRRPNDDPRAWRPGPASIRREKPDHYVKRTAKGHRECPGQTRKFTVIPRRLNSQEL